MGRFSLYPSPASFLALLSLRGRAGLRKFGALGELPVGAHHVFLPFYGILQRYESNTTILSQLKTWGPSQLRGPGRSPTSPMPNAATACEDSAQYKKTENHQFFRVFPVSVSVKLRILKWFQFQFQLNCPNLDSQVKSQLATKIQSLAKKRNWTKASVQTPPWKYR